MKFIALTITKGDYGGKKPGEIFDVPDHMVKRILHLEAKGIIQRYRAPRAAKAYTVYENKSVVPTENKTAK